MGARSIILRLHARPLSPTSDALFTVLFKFEGGSMVWLSWDKLRSAIAADAPRSTVSSPRAPPCPPPPLVKSTRGLWEFDPYWRRHRKPSVTSPELVGQHELFTQRSIDCARTLGTSARMTPGYTLFAKVSHVTGILPTSSELSSEKPMNCRCLVKRASFQKLGRTGERVKSCSQGHSNPPRLSLSVSATDALPLRPE
jgi:hypothetical protein